MASRTSRIRGTACLVFRRRPPYRPHQRGLVSPPVVATLLPVPGESAHRLLARPIRALDVEDPEVFVYFRIPSAPMMSL